jgi:hypothetical protein
VAIEFTTSCEDNLLIVKARGIDENADQVRQYGLAVISECLKQGATCVLCDERELRYRLKTFDTYQVAEFLAEQAPRVVRAAIVCDPRDIDDAMFWENVAVNRGLQVKVFKDIAGAKAWLMNP